MKKMLLVALTGLSLTLAAEQPASAGCKISIGAGFNFTFECDRNRQRAGGRGCDAFGDCFALPLDSCCQANSPAAPGFKSPAMPNADQKVGQTTTDGSIPSFLNFPGTIAPGDNTPRTVPNVMPRADHQPVGYFPQPQAQDQDQEEENNYAPSYWYGR